MGAVGHRDGETYEQYCAVEDRKKRALNPDEVNALEEKVRRYIADIETIADPAGMVQEIAALKDQVAALTARIKQEEQVGRARETNRQFRAFCGGKSWPY